MGQELTDLVILAASWLRSVPLIETLLAFMAADIASGFALAIVRRELNSSASILGFCRKAVVIVLVSACSVLQQHMPSEAPIGGLVALYFIGSEGLSLIENGAMLGVPMPEWLTRYFEKLQQEPSKRRAKRSDTPTP